MLAGGLPAVVVLPSLPPILLLPTLVLAVRQLSNSLLVRLVRVGGGKGALGRPTASYRSISVVAWTTATAPATPLVVGVVVAPIGRLVVWLKPLSGLRHHPNVEIAGRHWVAWDCWCGLQQTPSGQAIGSHLGLAGGQEDVVGLGGACTPCHVPCTSLGWALYQGVACVRGGAWGACCGCGDHHCPTTMVTCWKKGGRWVGSRRRLRIR